MTVRQVANTSIAVGSNISVDGLLIPANSFCQGDNIISVYYWRMSFVNCDKRQDASSNRMIGVNDFHIESFIAGSVAVINAPKHIPIDRGTVIQSFERSAVMQCEKSATTSDKLSYRFLLFLRQPEHHFAI